MPLDYQISGFEGLLGLNAPFRAELGDDCSLVFQDLLPATKESPFL